VEGLDKMKFFKVKSNKEVKDILEKLALNHIGESEVISTNKSRNRVIYSSIIAKENVPSYNRSTVDGYAIKSFDSYGATEAIPALVSNKGKVLMGKEVKDVINSGETMYVPTGGMIPNGADSVIMIEDTQLFDETTIGLNKPVSLGENIIFEGDDIKLNQLVIEKGKVITSMDIGILAALGINQIEVIKKPKVTIISTGDEIVDLNRKKVDAQIYDINGYVLNNLVEESGGEVIEKKIIKDNYEELFENVSKATTESDVILISGGSSVGTRDFTYDVINNIENSEVLVQGIAIKPGKPTIIGKTKKSLIVGLPGHPVSSIIVYKAFIDDYIRQIAGQRKKIYEFEGILSENIHSAPGKTTYQMVDLKCTNNQIIVTPNYGKSGMISLLSHSKGYIVIDAHQEGLNAGEIIRGYYL